MFNIYITQIYMCIYGRSYKLRFFKLRLIFRREKNRRTPEKNPRSTGEINYNNSTHTRFQVFLRINTRLYPCGHPSSYNENLFTDSWVDVISVHFNCKKVHEDDIFVRQDILQFFSGESKDYKDLKSP